MDHASLEELAKSYLRLRFDTAGAQRGKRKEKVGRGLSTRQTSSQNLGNVTAIESGKGPKLVFSAPLMVVPTHEQRTIGPAGTETALLDPNRVHHEYCRTKRLDAKLKRHQRRLARQKKGSNRRNRRKHRIARIQRKRANVLKNANHQVSRSIANCSSTVILEDLKIKAMIRSAKGTMESFGTNVRQKSGLNRGILRTGWGQLDQMLSYKCRKVIKVTAAYTSQRCSVCVHTEASHRKTRSKFTCMSCGHADHADLNAAANILASGIGAAARREAFGLPTPMTREIDTSASLCTVGHSRI